MSDPIFNIPNPNGNGCGIFLYPEDRPADILSRIFKDANKLAGVNYKDPVDMKVMYVQGPGPLTPGGSLEKISNNLPQPIEACYRIWGKTWIDSTTTLPPNLHDCQEGRENSQLNSCFEGMYVEVPFMASPPPLGSVVKVIHPEAIDWTTQCGILVQDQIGETGGLVNYGESSQRPPFYKTELKRYVPATGGLPIGASNFGTAVLGFAEGELLGTPKVELGGNNRGKFVAKYWAMGGPIPNKETYGPWCAAFVSWNIAQAANKLKKPLPFDTNLNAAKLFDNILNGNGELIFSGGFTGNVDKKMDSNSAPQKLNETNKVVPGDIVWWYAHIGIVKSYDEGTGILETIEGNIGVPIGKVVTRKHRMKGKHRPVAGIVRLPNLL